MIVSDADISAYYEVSNPNNSEKFVLKGGSALGKRFFIPSIYNDPANPEYHSSANEKVDIVATVDHTTIQITPTTNINGHPANITFEIVLDKGQTYSLESSVLGALAGTEITSDRVVAVTISDDGVMQNFVDTVSDLIGDQLIPVDAIGTEYIAVNTSKDSDSNKNQNSVQQVYVMAIEDNTTVVINNNTSNSTPLRKGEIVVFDIPDHALYIFADKNVYAYQVTGLVNESTDYANELGSAILPNYNCNGSNTVSFTRVLDREFWVNIVVKKKDDASFILYDSKGNQIDFSSYNNSWAPISGQDTGQEAWECCAVKMSDLAVGEPYTLVNTTGVFHLCILDENGASESVLGSISFGYFSSYNSFWVDGEEEACDGDLIELTAKDRMESYQWFSNETGDEILSTANVYNATSTGTYYVIGTENNGNCSFSQSMSLVFNPNPDVQNVEDTYCADEAAGFSIEDYEDRVMVSGSSMGNTYNWTGSLSIPEDGGTRTTNVFNVVVTNDDTGCTSTAQVTIYVNPDPEVQNAEDTFCADETVDFNISNYNDDVLISGSVEDYTFDWTGSLSIPEDGDSRTINNFDVVVTHVVTSCTSKALVTIYVNPDPAVRDIEDTYCADEAVGLDINNYNDDVLVSGVVEDYTFDWTGSLSIPDDGGTQVTNVFSVVVTNKITSCTSTAVANITVNPNPALQATSAIYCADEAADFDINTFNEDILTSGNVADYTFVWTGTLSIPADGDLPVSTTFSAVVTDKATGCTSETEVVITVNPDPALQTASAIYCADEAVDFDINIFNDDILTSGNVDDYTFVWTGTLAIPADGGLPVSTTFSAVVTDKATGCTSETDVVITVNPDPALHATSATYCADETDGFDINIFNDDILTSGNVDDYTFVWTGALAIPADGGLPVLTTFSVVVTDKATGCTNETEVV
ncbi:IgGFc-binding protein, partial [Plebeiibacterium sediminum]